MIAVASFQTRTMDRPPNLWTVPLRMTVVGSSPPMMVHPRNLSTVPLPMTAVRCPLLMAHPPGDDRRSLNAGWLPLDGPYVK